MNYELCVLFSGKETEDDVNKHAQVVASMLAEAGADIKHAYSLGRRKLAYDIKKQAHGDYRVWLFVAPTDGIKELEAKLRLNKNSLRHLLLSLKDAELAIKIKEAKEGKRELPAEGEEEPVKRASNAKTVEKTEEKKETGKKISIEELDDKLDEILESDKV